MLGSALRRLRRLGAQRQRSLLGLRSLRDPRALPGLRSLRQKLLRRRTSPNSRHRRSTNRLLVFQKRKRREEACGLSLTRILCRPAMQRLQESCFGFGASCPNSTAPAAVDPELDVAACARVLRSHGS